MLNIESGSRQETVRNHNLSLIATTSVTSGTNYSRAQLAELTGLNRSTVTRLTEVLISQGILTEDSSSRNGGSGRPSIPLGPAQHTHVAIGAELADTHMRTCVMNLAGQVLAEDFFELSDRTTPEEFTALLNSSIDRHETQISNSHMNIVGMTCGLPGIVNESDGRLWAAPNLGWGDTDLPALMKASGTKRHFPMRFENSINLSAFNELISSKLNHTELGDFLYISGSTGIGSAIVRNGKIESGTRGWGGEIGHMVVTNSESRCVCGTYGCLETVAGRQQILVHAGLDSDESVASLLASLRRRDRQANDAVKKVGVALGRAIASCLNFMDLPHVILGGIFADLFPYITDAITNEVHERLLFTRWAPLEITSSTGGERTAVKGGAWRSLLSFLDDPSLWVPPSDYALSYYSVEQTPEVDLDV